ncbi:MAG: hypothetical protein JNL38_03350 [Myxococcales bacterium]|nr:hypothetical protein [Myxococcales bacterium]
MRGAVTFTWIALGAALGVACGAGSEPATVTPVALPAVSSTASPAPTPPTPAAPIEAPPEGPLGEAVRDAAAAALPPRDAATEVFLEAYALEKKRDLAGARRRYYDLITKHPGSAAIPQAYLAFGELFFAEAEADPSKRELAAQAYREVVKYPPPGNAVHAFALLRLGEGFARAHDGPNALSSLRKALDALAQHPGSPEAARVERAAVQGLVTAYAESGRPEAAAAFFRASHLDVPAALAKLIAEYRRIGDPRPTLVAASAALDVGKHPDLCREAGLAAREASGGADRAVAQAARDLEQKQRATCGP